MMSIGEVAFSSIGLSWNTRNQNEDVSFVESSGGSEAGGIRLNFGAPRKLEGGFFLAASMSPKTSQHGL